MPRLKPQSDEVMSFGEHLESLRWHLVRALIGVGICLVLCLVAGESIVGILLAPLRRAMDAHQAGAIVVRSLMEGLKAYLQISLVGGLLLASPWVFYQFWAFIAPGLYSHEQRVVYANLPFLLGLFAVGVLFGWFVALPGAVEFMVRFNQGMGFEHQITVSSWVGLALVFPMAFGIAFELPLAMVVASRAGLCGSAGFRGHRRLAMLLATVLSAVLTPTVDVVSMLLMLVPLVALYEAGIWWSWLAERHSFAGKRREHEPPRPEDLLATLLISVLATRGASRRSAAPA